MIPGDLFISYGDVHIYDNHKEQVDLQLSREDGLKTLPILKLVEDEILWNCASQGNFDEFKVEDFMLENYNSYPPIEGKLSTGLK